MRYLILAAALAVAAPASAQNMPCGPRAAAVKMLADKHGETSQGYGTTGRLVMEMFANTDTGTWTLILNRPDGRACLMGAGENWTETPRPPVATGDPS